MTIGNQERGEARWSARLTEAEVMQIRSRYAAGESLSALSKVFTQCSKVNLHHIVHGKRWRYLLEAPRGARDIDLTRFKPIGPRGFRTPSHDAEIVGE